MKSWISRHLYSFSIFFQERSSSLIGSLGCPIKTCLASSVWKIVFSISSKLSKKKLFPTNEVSYQNYVLTWVVPIQRGYSGMNGLNLFSDNKSKTQNKVARQRMTELIFGRIWILGFLPLFENEKNKMNIFVVQKSSLESAWVVWGVLISDWLVGTSLTTM